jgi:hypothetical protein
VTDDPEDLIRRALRAWRRSDGFPDRPPQPDPALSRIVTVAGVGPCVELRNGSECVARFRILASGRIRRYYADPKERAIGELLAVAAQVEQTAASIRRQIARQGSK